MLRKSRIYLLRKCEKEALARIIRTIYCWYLTRDLRKKTLAESLQEFEHSRKQVELDQLWKYRLFARSATTFEQIAYSFDTRDLRNFLVLFFLLSSILTFLLTRIYTTTLNTACNKYICAKQTANIHWREILSRYIELEQVYESLLSLYTYLYFNREINNFEDVRAI